MKRHKKENIITNRELTVGFIIAFGIVLGMCIVIAIIMFDFINLFFP